MLQTRGFPQTGWMRAISFLKQILLQQPSSDEHNELCCAQPCMCLGTYVAKLGSTTLMCAFVHVLCYALRLIARRVFACVCSTLPPVCVNIPGENIKMPRTVPSAYGWSFAHTGPGLWIDRNEIFCNLNVNGSEIYRWVLCNYQCHNLLALCLCKTEGKNERIWGKEEKDEGKNKEDKWESVERLSGWQSKRRDDLYLVMLSWLSSLSADSLWTRREKGNTKLAKLGQEDAVKEKTLRRRRRVEQSQLWLWLCSV